MSKRNDFYIGWKEDMPDSTRSFLKKVLIPIFIFIPLLVVTVVFFQKPFNQHQFEFGNITTVTGIYYEKPFPILVADKGILPDSLSHDIVLVGYGKFGAQGIIKDIEKKHGAIIGKKVTLAGTLIYGDGKTLMELTELEASLVTIVDHNITTYQTPSVEKPISLSGEIIDPKCYFGVMKPGEGKVHKSCAIRCISGGIPPVFKAKASDQKEPARYYLIFDENGHEVNKRILPYVAEQIMLTGKTNQVLNWDILYVDLEDLVPVQ